MKKSETVTTYEMVLVYEPRFDDNEGLQAELEKVRQLIQTGEGNVLKEDLWGKRPLAYPINKFNNGMYVVFVFEGTSQTVATVERQLRITDTLLRFLTVIKDKNAPDFHSGLRYEREYSRGPRPSGPRDRRDSDDSIATDQDL